MFETETVEKIVTYILCSAIFSPKIVLFLDNVEKPGRAGEATDENKITAYALCMLDN